MTSFVKFNIIWKKMRNKWMFTNAMGWERSRQRGPHAQNQGKNAWLTRKRAAEVHKVYDRQRMAREALVMPHDSLTFLPFNLGWRHTCILKIENWHQIISSIFRIKVDLESDHVEIQSFITSADPIMTGHRLFHPKIPVDRWPQHDCGFKSRDC